MAKKVKEPKEELTIFARNGRTPFLLVLPALVTLICVVAYPMFWSLYYSLHQYNPIAGAAKFVGGANFKALFTSARFGNSVIHLVYYLFVGVTAQMVLAIVVALLLYELVKNRNVQLVLLTIFIIPMMIPPSVVGNIWKFILIPMGGVLNSIVVNVFHKPPIEWFSAKLALTSVMIADIWQWTSLPLMIIFSGRVSLPESVYEASRVDGSTPWMTLTRITLPMLRELIAISFMLRFMDCYKYIDKLIIMTSGGPGEASELPSYLGYVLGVQQFNIGEATSMVWVIALVAVGVLTLFIRFMKKVLAAQKMH
jgi:multiple sugar transport system permease protein